MLITVMRNTRSCEFHDAIMHAAYRLTHIYRMHVHRAVGSALQPFLNFNKVDRTGHGFQTVKLYSSPLESLFFFFFFPDVYTCAFPNEDQLERFESEKFPSFFNPSEFNG